MTNDQNYIKSLNFTKELYKDLENKEIYGYSTYESASLSDRIIIRQNNLLIHLLTTLINKIDNIPKLPSLDLAKSLEDITNKIANLQIDKRPKFQQPQWQFFKEDLTKFPRPV